MRQPKFGTLLIVRPLARICSRNVCSGLSVLSKISPRIRIPSEIRGGIPLDVLAAAFPGIFAGILPGISDDVTLGMFPAMLPEIIRILSEMSLIIFQVLLLWYL